MVKPHHKNKKKRGKQKNKTKHKQQQYTITSLCNSESLLLENDNINGISFKTNILEPFSITSVSDSMNTKSDETNQMMTTYPNTTLSFSQDNFTDTIKFKRKKRKKKQHKSSCSNLIHTSHSSHIFPEHAETQFFEIVTIDAMYPRSVRVHSWGGHLDPTNKLLDNVYFMQSDIKKEHDFETYLTSILTGTTCHLNTFMVTEDMSVVFSILLSVTCLKENPLIQKHTRIPSDTIIESTQSRVLLCNTEPFSEPCHILCEIQNELHQYGKDTMTIADLHITYTLRYPDDPPKVTVRFSFELTEIQQQTLNHAIYRLLHTTSTDELYYINRIVLICELIFSLLMERHTLVRQRDSALWEQMQSRVIAAHQQDVPLDITLTKIPTDHLLKKREHLLQSVHSRRLLSDQSNRQSSIDLTDTADFNEETDKEFDSNDSAGALYPSGYNDQLMYDNPSFQLLDQQCALRDTEESSFQLQAGVSERLKKMQESKLWNKQSLTTHIGMSSMVPDHLQHNVCHFKEGDIFGSPIISQQSIQSVSHTMIKRHWDYNERDLFEYNTNQQLLKAKFNKYYNVHSFQHRSQYTGSASWGFCNQTQRTRQTGPIQNNELSWPDNDDTHFPIQIDRLNRPSVSQLKSKNKQPSCKDSWSLLDIQAPINYSKSVSDHENRVSPKIVPSHPTIRFHLTNDQNDSQWDIQTNQMRLSKFGKRLSVLHNTNDSKLSSDHSINHPRNSFIPFFETTTLQNGLNKQNQEDHNKPLKHYIGTSQSMQQLYTSSKEPLQSCLDHPIESDYFQRLHQNKKTCVYRDERATVSEIDTHNNLQLPPPTLCTQMLTQHHDANTNGPESFLTTLPTSLPLENKQATCELDSYPEIPLHSHRQQRTTRYTKDFEELGCLGESPRLGQIVTHVRHRIDRNVYAIKRIPWPSIASMKNVSTLGIFGTERSLLDQLLTHIYQLQSQSGHLSTVSLQQPPGLENQGVCEHGQEDKQSVTVNVTMSQNCNFGTTDITPDTTLLYHIHTLFHTFSTELYRRVILEVSKLSRLQHGSISRIFQSWIQRTSPSYEESEDRIERFFHSPYNKLDRKQHASSVMSSLQKSLSLIDLNKTIGTLETLKHVSPTLPTLSPGKIAASSVMLGQSDRVFCLQLEFCPGATLRDLIDSGGLGVREQRKCWALFRQLLEALVVMHRDHLYHRALHPGNIFIETENDTDHALSQSIKLGDFGLSSLIRRETLWFYLCLEYYLFNQSYNLSNVLIKPNLNIQCSSPNRFHTQTSIPLNTDEMFHSNGLDNGTQLRHSVNKTTTDIQPQLELLFQQFVKEFGYYLPYEFFTSSILHRLEEFLNVRHSLKPFLETFISKTPEDHQQRTELFYHQYLDEKCDMFSLGLILFDIFHEPFRSCSQRFDAFRRIISRHNSATDLLNSLSCPAAAILILRLTDPNPNLRPTASHLLYGEPLVPPTVGKVVLKQFLHRLSNSSTNESRNVLTVLYSRLLDVHMGAQYFRFQHLQPELLRQFLTANSNTHIQIISKGLLPILGNSFAFFNTVSGIDQGRLNSTLLRHHSYLKNQLNQHRSYVLKPVNYNKHNNTTPLSPNVIPHSESFSQYTTYPLSQRCILDETNPEWGLGRFPVGFYKSQLDWAYGMNTRLFHLTAARDFVWRTVERVFIGAGSQLIDLPRFRYSVTECNCGNLIHDPLRFAITDPNGQLVYPVPSINLDDAYDNTMYDHIPRLSSSMASSESIQYPCWRATTQQFRHHLTTFIKSELSSTNEFNSTGESVLTNSNQHSTDDFGTIIKQHQNPMTDSASHFIRSPYSTYSTVPTTYQPDNITMTVSSMPGYLLDMSGALMALTSDLLSPLALMCAMCFIDKDKHYANHCHTFDINIPSCIRQYCIRSVHTEGPVFNSTLHHHTIMDQHTSVPYIPTTEMDGPSTSVPSGHLRAVFSVTVYLGLAFRDSISDIYNTQLNLLIIEAEHLITCIDAIRPLSPMLGQIEVVWTHSSLLSSIIMDICHLQDTERLGYLDRYLRLFGPPDNVLYMRWILFIAPISDLRYILTTGDPFHYFDTHYQDIASLEQELLHQHNVLMKDLKCILDIWTLQANALINLLIKLSPNLSPHSHQHKDSHKLSISELSNSILTALNDISAKATVYLNLFQTNDTINDIQQVMIDVLTIAKNAPRTPQMIYHVVKHIQLIQQLFHMTCQENPQESLRGPYVPVSYVFDTMLNFDLCSYHSNASVAFVLYINGIGTGRYCIGTGGRYDQMIYRDVKSLQSATVSQEMSFTPYHHYGDSRTVNSSIKHNISFNQSSDCCPNHIHTPTSCIINQEKFINSTLLDITPSTQQNKLKSHEMCHQLNHSTISSTKRPYAIKSGSPIQTLLETILSLSHPGVKVPLSTLSKKDLISKRFSPFIGCRTGNMMAFAAELDLERLSEMLLAVEYHRLQDTYSPSNKCSVPQHVIGPHCFLDTPVNIKDSLNPISLLYNTPATLLSPSDRNIMTDCEYSKQSIIHHCYRSIFHTFNPIIVVVIQKKKHLVDGFSLVEKLIQQLHVQCTLRVCPVYDLTKFKERLYNSPSVFFLVVINSKMISAPCGTTHSSGVPDILHSDKHIDHTIHLDQKLQQPISSQSVQAQTHTSSLLLNTTTGHHTQSNEEKGHNTTIPLNKVSPAIGSHDPTQMIALLQQPLQGGTSISYRVEFLYQTMDRTTIREYISSSTITFIASNLISSPVTHHYYSGTNTTIGSTSTHHPITTNTMHSNSTNHIHSNHIGPSNIYAGITTQHVTRSNRHGMLHVLSYATHKPYIKLDSETEVIHTIGATIHRLLR